MQSIACLVLSNQWKSTDSQYSSICQAYALPLLPVERGKVVLLRTMERAANQLGRWSRLLGTGHRHIQTIAARSDGVLCNLRKGFGHG